MRRRVAVMVLAAVLIGLTSYMALADETIKILVNGKEVRGDTPAQVINGRTMVPIRLVSEALGAKVEWKENDRSVEITAEPVSQFKLLTVNGEKTTWPYWYENGVLYLEYRNTLELLRMFYNHPFYSIVFYKDQDRLAINNKVMQVMTTTRGDFKLISLNYLRDRERVVNFTFDPDTGALNIEPIK